MRDMVRMTVAHLGLDRTTNTPVVILREDGGERTLSIWIGPPEANGGIHGRRFTVGNQTWLASRVRVDGPEIEIVLAAPTTSFVAVKPSCKHSPTRCRNWPG